MKIKRSLGSGLLVLLLVLFFHPSLLHAATRTWDGSSSGLWTTAANWDLNTVPVNGDLLIFPPGPTRLLTTNSVGGATNFHSLTLSGSNYFLFGSAPLSITNGLTNVVAATFATNTFRAPLVLRASQTWLTSVKTILVLASNVNFTNLTLTLVNTGQVEVLGVINGGAGSTLLKTNAGKLLINGTASLTHLFARDGAVQVDGTLSGLLTVDASALLSGSGTVSSFTNSGTVSPGFGGPGVLTVSSLSPVFKSGSSFAVDIDGLTPGTQHDQLKTAVAPTFQGGTLSVSLGFTPKFGDSFVILTNTGAGAISGNFTGLPEGATQTVGNVKFRISYVGGSGNDVTLTAVDITASGVTRTWTGLGTNNLWSNRTNWAGNIAPAGGDNLVFPLSALQRTNINDFAAGMTMNSITIVDGGYSLTGTNSLRLLAGLATTSTNQVINLSLSLALARSQIFSHAGPVALSVLRGVDLGVNTLTISNQGSVLLQNGTELKGTGGLVKTGAGTLTIFPSNSFSGPVSVEQGRLIMRHVASLGSTAGGTTVAAGSTLEIFAFPAGYALAEPLTIAGSLTVSSSSITNTVPLTLSSTNAFLQVDLLTNRLELTANVLSGVAGAGFTKSGFGTVAMQGSSTHERTAIFGGTVLVNGAQPTNHILINGSGGFILFPQIGGTGTVGTITASSAFTNGLVSPGNSPGILTSGHAAITNTHFTVELNGTTPGSGHDQLNVLGGVTLGSNAILDVTLGYVPLPGDSFTIINNDGADAVIGTFNGLPQGALITNGATILQISYTGGTGNDVTLTVPPLPAVTTQAAVGLTATNAGLKALVTPNGTPTLVWFQYGTTTNYGLLSPTNLIGAFSVTTVTQFVAGLSPSTLYHFRAVAENSTGPTNGGDLTFTTLALAVPPPPVTRGPYLLNGTTNSALVRWCSSAASDGYVRYGTNINDLNLGAAETTVKTNHIVQLTNLAPNTTYYYSVGTSNSTLAVQTNFFFTTPPHIGTPQHTRLWVLGDAGTSGLITNETPSAVGNAGQLAVRDAYNTYAATNGKADLILMLGDNAYNTGTDAEYQLGLFRIYTNNLCNTFTYACVGNHDTAFVTTTNEAIPMFNWFTSPKNGEVGGLASGNNRYYSFDHANVHFVVLDSMATDFQNLTNNANPMRNWLTNDLASTLQPWIIVFFHHPPYTKGSHNSDFEGDLIQIRATWTPLLESYGVDLVLNGHSHVYERTYLIQGHTGLANTFTTNMVVAGGSGDPLGTGAYQKNSGDGTIYAVAGSAGQAGSVTAMPVMYKQLGTLGSMVIDVTGNRLDAIFLTTSPTNAADRFAIIKPVAPVAPTTLIATAVTSNQIQLSWTDNATNEFGFRIERGIDGVNFTQIASLGSNVINYLDSGLPAGTTYYYRVTATNDVQNSDSSNIASATTFAPPVITSHPASRTNTVGTTANFSVTASGSSLAYQWRFNGTNLSGQTASTLAVNNVQLSNAGPYTVHITNSFGSITSTIATLTVGDPAGIATAPTNLVVLNGQTAVFTVVAGGTPPYAYQWTKNNSNVGDATNASLSILNAQDADEGDYRVQVSNVVGVAVGGPATLTVLATNPPALLSAQKLSNGYFQITFSGVTGQTYALDRSPNLLNWTQWIAFTNVTAQTQLTDTTATNANVRFYRSRLLLLP